jgi:hypothetical protein
VIPAVPGAHFGLSRRSNVKLEDMRV